MDIKLVDQLKIIFNKYGEIEEQFLKIENELKALAPLGINYLSTGILYRDQEQKMFLDNLLIESGLIVQILNDTANILKIRLSYDTE